jgi:ribonucleoside-triphosphate reductase
MSMTQQAKSNGFHEEVTLDPFEGAPLGSLVFQRTYSRTRPDGLKETWDQMVQRVVDGNLSLVSPAFIEESERARLIYLISNRIALPAGRHLWASGTTSMALQNCFRAGQKNGFQSHCAFTFDQLMKGGGVGANYSTSYFSKMPRFLSRVVPTFICDSSHPDYQEMVDLSLFDIRIDDPYINNRIVVEDSREGWVNALETLIWHCINSVPLTLIYDVSKVRCKGSPIRGFGGTAAGPMPLMLMLIEVAKLLNNQRGKRPTPLFAMNVDHEIAKCVVAGNVRRSARMSIVHWNDPEIFEFINCKTDPLHHWSTNISVEIDDSFFDALDENDSHAHAVMNAVIKGMLTNGEPGFYNSSQASKGELGDVRATNPCGELALEEWESCILGHVNLAKGTEEEKAEAFRLMARFLYRTTFAKIQDPKQREVVERNRRIGVGFFGLQEWMATLGLSYSGPAEDMRDLAWRLTKFKKIVVDAATQYANSMGTPVPIKFTTVAPTGTIAKLAGTTEGMQSIYAKHFVRRVRYADDDPGIPAQWPAEPCLYNKNTTVVSIPCEDPVVTRVGENAHLIVDAASLSVDDSLRLQYVIQSRYADNSISHTINLPQGTDPNVLKDALLQYLPKLKGTTVMVDATRPQQPYERISESDFQILSLRGYESTQNEEDSCQGSCPVK